MSGNACPSVWLFWFDSKDTASIFYSTSKAITLALNSLSRSKKQRRNFLSRYSSQTQSQRFYHDINSPKQDLSWPLNQMGLLHTAQVHSQFHSHTHLSHQTAELSSNVKVVHKGRVENTDPTPWTTPRTTLWTTLLLLG